MNSFIFFAIGFFYITSSLISANQYEEECGGPSTEVTIKGNLHGFKEDICYGHQIHSNAVIIPASCINGIAKEDISVLKIIHIFGSPEIVRETRNVTHIFVYPSYSLCSAKNDLAILVFADNFDIVYNTICWENFKLIEPDRPHLCSNVPASYKQRQMHVDSNGVLLDKCSLANDHALSTSMGNFYFRFEVCVYNFKGSLSAFKNLNGYELWGSYFKNQEEIFTSFTYDLYDVKDWLDQILQHAIPISLNKSMTSMKKDKSLDNLNIKH